MDTGSSRLIGVVAVLGAVQVVILAALAAVTAKLLAKVRRLEARQAEESNMSGHSARTEPAGPTVAERLAPEPLAPELGGPRDVWLERQADDGAR